MLRTHPLLGTALLWGACAAVDPGSPSPHDDDLARDASPDVDPAPTRATVSAADVAWLPPAVVRHAAAIDAAAERHAVDPRLVAIVVEVESRGEPDAVSPIGALGLMQVMPATAADIAQRHGLAVPTDTALREIDTNLDFGTRLLAELVADFGDPALDAQSVHRVATAYNGGSGVVLGNRAASEETVRYAACVVALWGARDDLERP